jgi:hypothetical protein
MKIPAGYIVEKRLRNILGEPHEETILTHPCGSYIAWCVQIQADGTPSHKRLKSMKIEVSKIIDQHIAYFNLNRAA